MAIENTFMQSIEHLRVACSLHEILVGLPVSLNSYRSTFPIFDHNIINKEANYHYYYYDF